MVSGGRFSSSSDPCFGDGELAGDAIMHTDLDGHTSVAVYAFECCNCLSIENGFTK